MNAKEMIKKFEFLEEHNYHTEAMQLVCEYFDRLLDAKKLHHINALHDLYASLPEELRKLRSEIWDSVKEQFYEVRRTVNIHNLIEENYNKCKSLAEDFDGDIYQAAEYLLNQI